MNEPTDRCVPPLIASAAATPPPPPSATGDGDVVPAPEIPKECSDAARTRLTGPAPPPPLPGATPPLWCAPPTAHTRKMHIARKGVA